jgi:hypothetical protein
MVFSFIFIFSRVIDKKNPQQRLSRDFRAYLKKPQRGFATLADPAGAIDKLKRETENHLDPLLPDMINR